MLNERQLEVVMHLCNGLKTHEIAVVMHLSESSVNQTIAAAKRNCGARTQAHLASIVIASGCLYWKDDERTTEQPDEGRYYPTHTG